MQQAYAKAVAERRNFDLRVSYMRRDDGGGEQQQQQQQQALTSGRDGAAAAPDGAGGGQLMTGMIQFRFAQNTGIDSKMPLIGIPNFLPSTDDAPHYYFAMLKELGPAPRQPQQLQLTRGSRDAASAAADGGPSRSSFEATGSANSETLSSAAVMGGSVSAAGGCCQLLPNNDAFDDISLGQLIGKGSFGRVYRAKWNGMTVAVKVVEFMANGRHSTELDQPWLAAEAQRSNAGGGGGGGANGGAAGAQNGGGGFSGENSGTQQPRAMLEGLLQERVSHPNIVRNFQFMMRELPCDEEDEDEGDEDEDEPPPAPSDTSSSFLRTGSTAAAVRRTSSTNSNGGAGGGGGAPRKPLVLPRPQKRQMMEAWLVLEFCNRTSIADAVEKGWFRQRHSGFEPHHRAIIATAREVASAMDYLHGEVGLAFAVHCIGSGRGFGVCGGSGAGGL